MPFFLPQILLSVPRNPVTAVGFPLALGLLSGASTAGAAREHWYQKLTFPPGRPPRIVFSLVWPILYASMGYASYIAVDALDFSMDAARSSNLNFAVGLYYAQLGLNCLWSPLFFKQKKFGAALADSVLLTGTTFYMTKLLDGLTDGQTTPFLLPYCAWLTFATYLNGGVWWMNRTP